jgi:hypothetical protein
MRITSYAPSMTKPTYALPQGTFGASTPVVRSVAPAATETQRSGGGAPGRRFSRLLLAGFSSALLGPGGFAAQAAETLGTKVTPAGVECRLADVAEITTKIPPNVMDNATPVIGGEPGETIALRLAANIDGIRGACLNQWKKTDRNSPQLSALDYQVNGIEAGTVVATNPSTGGACYKADAARAFQLKERERLTANGEPLSPKAEELDGAANDYWDLKQIAQNLFDPIFGKGTVCAAIDAGLRLATSLSDIEGLVKDAGKLFDIFNVEVEKLNQ